MKPGVQIHDIVIGTGEEALRDKGVIVNVRFFLPDGTELSGTLTPMSNLQIDLRKRDGMAGLRYGIEGMRVGGRRELIISPHLAYGEQGVPDRIPPNTKLRCEVELLEIREPGVVKPEDYPPGWQLIVGWSGDASRGVARWQFGLHEDGRYYASVTIPIPIPGMKWHHARPKYVAVQMEPTRTTILFEEVRTLPKRHPQDCLTHDQVCVDYSGQSGGVLRNRETDAPCLAVTICERGQVLCLYYIAESSPAWMTTGLHDLIRELIAPVLKGTEVPISKTPG